MGKGMYGHHVVILAFEIMREFIKNINNLKSIHMVSGNHDRSTSDAKHDNEGDVAGLLAYMLRNSFDKINVEFSTLVLGSEIDGIYYVMTNNHHALSIRDLNMKAQDYGDYKDFRLNLSQLTLDGNEDGSLNVKTKSEIKKIFSGEVSIRLN